jgi:hypothetical protein
VLLDLTSSLYFNDLILPNGLPIERPLMHLTIGKQLQWLNKNRRIKGGLLF